MTQPFTKHDNIGRLCRLVHDDGRPAHIGEEITDFRGDKAYLTGGEPPHRFGTSGHVYTRGPKGDGGHYYPHVFNLKWVLDAAPD